MSEWIEIHPTNSKFPEGPTFLLMNEFEHVYVGCTAFDFYDAKYWFPMPKIPMNKGIITNDEWITLAAQNGMLK